MPFLSFCASVLAVCPHDILSQQSVLEKARLRAGYKYGLYLDEELGSAEIRRLSSSKIQQKKVC